MLSRTLAAPCALGLALAVAAVAAPAPAITHGSSGPGAGTARAPVMGRTALLERLSGRILVKPPAARGFMALHGRRTVPIGTVIDASHGTLRLLTALSLHRRTQAARIWGDSFRVLQNATGNGMTRLLLVGARPSCAVRSRARAASTRRRRVKSRGLWAEDDHGLYSTYGANSVASVRGTRWGTIESCAGTRTVVSRGRVAVRDLSNGRTVLLGAGASYLAPTPAAPLPATTEPIPPAPPAEPLNPRSTSCNGTYSGSGREVTVPAGALCRLLAGTVVSGNLHVERGGALVEQGVVIAGNLQADGAASIRIGGGGSIGGDLQMQGLTAGPDSLCDTIVKGNVQVQDDGPNAPLHIGDLGACAGGPGLTVGGNLEVQNSAADITVAGNAVRGNLQLHDNAARLTVTANRAGGSIQVHDNSVGLAGTLTGNTAGGDCELANDSPVITGSENTAGPGRHNTCNAGA